MANPSPPPVARYCSNDSTRFPPRRTLLSLRGLVNSFSSFDADVSPVDIILASSDIGPHRGPTLNEDERPNPSNANP